MSSKPPILILNPQKREQLFWMTCWIPLTPVQYRVLNLLASHPQQVISADQIYDVITEGKTIVEPGQVAYHISALKSLSTAMSAHTLPIANVPARGYILDIPEMSIILVPEATNETP